MYFHTLGALCSHPDDILLPLLVKMLFTVCPDLIMRPLLRLEIGRNGSIVHEAPSFHEKLEFFTTGPWSSVTEHLLRNPLSKEYTSQVFNNCLTGG